MTVDGHRNYREDPESRWYRDDPTSSSGSDVASDPVTGEPGGAPRHRTEPLDRAALRRVAAQSGGQPEAKAPSQLTGQIGPDTGQTAVMPANTGVGAPAASGGYGGVSAAQPVVPAPYTVEVATPFSSSPSAQVPGVGSGASPLIRPGDNPTVVPAARSAMSDAATAVGVPPLPAATSVPQLPSPTSASPSPGRYQSGHGGAGTYKSGAYKSVTVSHADPLSTVPPVSAVPASPGPSGGAGPVAAAPGAGSVYRSRRKGLVAGLAAATVLTEIPVLRLLVKSIFSSVVSVAGTVSALFLLVGLPLFAMGMYGAIGGTATTQGLRAWAKTPLVYLPIALVIFLAAGLAAR